MSAYQLRTLCYLAGGYLFGTVAVWLGFAAYLYFTGRL